MNMAENVCQSWVWFWMSSVYLCLADLLLLFFSFYTFPEEVIWWLDCSGVSSGSPETGMSGHGNTGLPFAGSLALRGDYGCGGEMTSSSIPFIPLCSHSACVYLLLYVYHWISITIFTYLFSLLIWFWGQGPSFLFLM